MNYCYKRCVVHDNMANFDMDCTFLQEEAFLNFAAECLLKNDRWNLIFKSKIYGKYLVFCIKNDISPLKRIRFFKLFAKALKTDVYAFKDVFFVKGYADA